MLCDSLPVYVSANNSISGGGHAWVIDGAMIQLRNPGSPQMEVRNLYHCNFGWGGICDGYYVKDIFDLRNGAPVFDEEGNSGTANSYYSKGKKMIKYTTVQ